MTSRNEPELSPDDYQRVYTSVQAKKRKERVDTGLFNVLMDYLTNNNLSQNELKARLEEDFVELEAQDAATLYRNANITLESRKKLIACLRPQAQRTPFEFAPCSIQGEYKLYDCLRQLHQAGFRSGPRQQHIDNGLFEIFLNHLTASPSSSKKALVAKLQDEFVNKENASAFELYRNANTTPKHRLALLMHLVPEEDRATFTFAPSNTVGDYKLYDCLKQLNKAGFGSGHLEDFRHLISGIKSKEGRGMFSFLSGYGIGHLEDFRRLIHDVKYKSNFWALGLLSAATTALSFGYFHMNPDKLSALEQTLEHTVPDAVERGLSHITKHHYPIVKDFLHKTFTALKSIPLLLVIWTVLQIPLQLGKTWFHDDFKAPWRRFQKLMAGLLPPTLSIMAYGICYMANGVFTPLAAVFFVAASFVDVADNALTLHLLHKKEKAQQALLKETEASSEETDLTEASPESLYAKRIKAQRDLRQTERLSRTGKTATVKLVSAVFITLAAAIWCYFPPSFFVMLSCITFILLVGYTKNARLTKIHTDSTKALQQELNSLYVKEQDALHELYQKHQALRPVPNSSNSLALSSDGEGFNVDAYRNTLPLDSSRLQRNSSFISSVGSSSSHPSSDNDESDDDVHVQQIAPEFL